jgi:hypothetical protein
LLRKLEDAHHTSIGCTRALLVTHASIAVVRE